MSTTSVPDRLFRDNLLNDPDVGSYGTLRLMKSLDPNKSVAVYPVDDPEVTFGRNPDCSVRLYYPWVSGVHCKIIFEDRKAFLIVLGTNGLLIDGCQVFPSPPHSAPTTVPLPNNSEIEIHKKCFRFTYPPKALRTAVPSTPLPRATPSRRALRLSMIQSARVFSPRPSEDPRENLRILQSPLKHPATGFAKSEESDEDVVLVDGNNPTVLEEEADLVIVEHVERQKNPQSVKQEVGTSKLGPSFVPSMPLARSLPQTPPPPPRHRSRAPSTVSALHRAVLIRSAQRAAQKLEEKVQDEAEEEEVEEVVSPKREIISSGSEESQEEDDDDDDEEEEEEEEEGHIINESQPNTISGWRKSLEVVKGLGRVVGFGASPRADHEQQGEEDQEEERDITEVTSEEEEPFHYDTHEDNEDHPVQDEGDIEEIDDDETTSKVVGREQADHSTPQPRYALGNFMTPQGNTFSREGKGREIGHPARKSYGGFGAAAGGAQRVRMVEPWKIKDIVLPEYEGLKASVKYEDTQNNEKLSTTASKMEKQAIQDRRTSTHKAPHAFFPHVPGTKRQDTSSPFAAPAAVTSESRGETNKEEAQVMLEQMKETVEGMRRRSLGARITAQRGGWGRMSLSPSKKAGAFSLLATNNFDIVKEESGTQMEAVPEDDVTVALVDHVDALTVPNAEGMSPRTGPEVNAGECANSDGIGRQGGLVQKTPTHISSASLAPNSKQTQLPSSTTPHKQPQVLSQLATPKYTGLKELFMERKSIGTPTYEGIGEMMATPVAYKSIVSTDFGNPEMAAGGSSTVVHAAVSEQFPTRGKKSTGSSSKHAVDLISPIALNEEDEALSVPKTAPRRKTRIAAAKGTPTDLSGMADDEATPTEPDQRRNVIAIDDKKIGPPGAKVHKSRARRANDEFEEAIVTSGTKTKKATRTKKVVPPVPVIDNDESHQEELPIVAQSRRTRKVETEDPSEHAEVVESSDATGKSMTGSRKIAQPVSTSEDNHIEKPKTVRKTRGQRLPAESDSDKPAPRKTITRRGRSKNTDESSGVESSTTTFTRPNIHTKVVIVESESDVDPLDSIDRSESPEQEVMKSKGRTRTRKHFNTIAEEEVCDGQDIVEIGETTLTKRSTARKTPVSKAKTSSGTTPTIPGDSALDKENTPEPHGSGIDDHVATSGKIALRSNTRKKANGKVVKEEEQVSVPATRNTRARTRK